MTGSQAHLCHLTPHFCTLYICNMAGIGEVQPICFIQFWADKEIEVADALIFSYQRGSQAQLAVRLGNPNNLRHTPLCFLIVLSLPPPDSQQENELCFQCVESLDLAQC